VGINGGWIEWVLTQDRIIFVVVCGHGLLSRLPRFLRKFWVIFTNNRSCFGNCGEIFGIWFLSIYVLDLIFVLSLFSPQRTNI
jgi:hypothetical protein